MATVEIVSFGYLHAVPPVADRVEDLRPIRDPHAAKHLRYLTANDELVRAAVMGTPGVRELVQQVAAWVDKKADTMPVVTVGVG